MMHTYEPTISIVNINVDIYVGLGVKTVKLMNGIYMLLCKIVLKQKPIYPNLEHIRRQ